ncbi:DNA polymerase theta isoform X3 [Bemisia tabaci]|uniref:DNA polymerase theta isoform X3 n=1 Tax=Bemisia tabaci TaxID=7038 RepID=UPI003B28202E
MFPSLEFFKFINLPPVLPRPCGPTVTNILLTQHIKSGHSDFKSKMSDLSESVSSSSSSSRYNLMLESWGLPKTILQQYKKQGVESMFQWQFDCLTHEGVLAGSNLVFSAPTSAGKTMVAEIIAIQTVLERKKKVLIILPFISVVREKMVHLQDLFKGTGVRVEGFMGSHAPPGGLKSVQIAIATIEKANSLINRLLEEGCLSEIGCVVVDELHLIGDPHRGYLLELLLTKLKYMSKKMSDCQVQVIGMSATLPNLNLLANWLSAVLFKTDFRPIPLVEYLKVESDVITTDNLRTVRKVCPQIEIKNDSGDVIWLCLETILSGHSILIFCQTKNWCETLASQISAEFMRIGSGSTEIAPHLRERLSREAIMEMLEQLKICPAGLDKTLEKCVSFGVSFHHAGLTLEERNIIEGNFRSGTLKVLVATSTLSSGVNLPARRVIIRSPSFRNQPIDILSYKQMVGRAGRMGVDSQGESFLICTKAERKIGEKLVKSSLPPVTSCLGRTDISNSLKRAILEVIASGVVCSTAEAKLYASCTLLAASLDNGFSNESLLDPITSSLQYLETNEFIKSAEESLTPTLLANACLSASLPPDQGIKLLKELHRARQCFVLDTELHVIYQVTPFSVSEQWGSQLDWLHILSLWENLTPSMRKVGEMVGVDERFLVRAVRGTVNYKSTAHLEKMTILRRFYTALALQDLVNEMPLSQVASKYQASKGMIQSLQQSASAFAGLVTQFCRRLGWATIELLVSQFCDRLQFGVHRELIDLLRCQSLDASRARALFNCGIETLTDLAAAEEDQVEKALRKAIPFESDKEDLKNQCRRIWVAGRSGLTEREAAALAISEAREILKHELGLKKVEWGSDRSQSDEAANIPESSNSDTISKTSTPSHPTNKNLSPSQTFGSTRVNETACDHGMGTSVSTESDCSSNIESNKMKLFLKSSQDSCDTLSNHESNGESKENQSNNFNSSFKSSHDNSSMIASQEILKCTKKLSVSQTSPSQNFEVVEETQSTCKSIKNSSNMKAVIEETEVFDSEQIPSSVSINLNCDIGERKRESYDIFDCMQVDDSVFQMISTNELRPKSVGKVPSQNFISSPFDLELSGCSENKAESLNSSSIVETSLINPKKSQSLDSPSFFETSVDERKWSSKVSIIKPKILNSSGCMEASILTANPTQIDSPSLIDTLLLSKKKLNSLVQPKQKQIKNSLHLEITENINSIRKSADMFQNLPFSDVNYSVNPAKRLSIEMFNSDSGGDSILESSLLIYEETLKELKAEARMSGKKRKRKSMSTRLVKPKLDTNLKESASVADKVSSPDLFEASFSGQINSANASLNSNTNANQKSISPENSMFAQTLNLDTQLCQELDGVATRKMRKKSHELATKIPVSQKFRRQTRLSQKLGAKLTQSRPCKTATPDKLLDDVFLSDTQEFSLIKNHPKLRRSSRNSSYQKPTGAPSLVANAKKIGAKTRSSIRKSKGSDNGDDIVGNSQEVNTNKPTRGSRFSFGRKPGPAAQKLPVKKKVMQKDNAAVYHLCKNNKLNRAHFERLLRQKSSLCLCMKYVKGVAKESNIGRKFIKKSTRSSVNSAGSKINKFNGASLILTFTADAEDIYYLDLNANDECGIEILKEIFSCSACTIITVNAKYIYKIINRFFHLAWNCSFLDMAVAHWLLEPHSGDYSFEFLAKYYLLEKLHNSMVEDVRIVYQLYRALEAKLTERNLMHVFKELEMPCQLILAQLESAGIIFDRPLANHMSLEAEVAMNAVQEKIFKLAGKKFNLNSPKEWKQVKKSLKVAEMKLEETHPIIVSMSQWRKIHHLLSKVLNPLLLASSNSSKIHGSCYTHTVTGRVSMLEPNLQMVPRDFSIASHFFSPRSAFLSAKGNKFLSADFRQLELRILAHLSGDESLKEALLSGDVFINIAAKWNHVPAEEVSDTMRQQTKQLCYGLIYGMGSNTLSTELGVSVETATKMAEEFKDAYPGVKQYIKRVVEECRQTERIFTLAGRYRVLENICHTNPGVRSQAERQAVNSTIQGSAADVAKAAMIKVDTKLRQFTQDKNDVTAHLVLQMHDELIYEVSDQYVFEAAKIIESAMTSAVTLSVLLPVKIRSGSSWGSLQAITTATSGDKVNFCQSEMDKTLLKSPEY